MNSYRLQCPGTQVFTSVNVLAGSNKLTFAVPLDARKGQRFARFRLSTAGGLAPSGGAVDGEVEDHLLTIGNPLGSGVFGDSGQSLGNHESVDVALGDLDGDGDLDAFVANLGQGNRVWLNRNGVFSDSGQVLGNHESDGVALGDLDGDGDLDAFVASDRQGNRVWLNNGGVFSDSMQPLGNHDSRNVALGDLDGDGDLDAVVANVAGQGNRVWVNDAGIFNDSGQSLGGDTSTGVSVDDLDRDGDLDIFFTNYHRGNRVWLNNGTGLFSDSGQSLGSHASRGVSLGDLDGDGDIDAFVINQFQGNRVWLNSGGVFNDSGQVLGNRDRRDVSLGDLDGDGDLDAFVVNRLADNRVWLNNGGVFTNTGQALGDHWSIGVSLGDLDGDGDLDAFVANHDQGNRVWIDQESNSLLSVAPLDATRLEGDLGTTPFTFEVRRTGDTGSVASVFYTVTGSGDNPADAADFGGALPSGTVSFAPNEISQVVTIDVSGDTLVEADEEFTVTLSRLTPTTYITTPAATGTIQDDDLLPKVTLTLDNSAIGESAGVATFTAALSAITTEIVTVDLGFTGTATIGVDYAPSSPRIVISAGQLAGAATITAVQDSLEEADETVIVEITNVINGIELGNQTQTATIIDDDSSSRLLVTSLEPISTGFVAQFNTELDVNALNLFDTQTAGLGPADVVLRGETAGTVAGSLVVNQSSRMVTFIKTGGPLVADTYTVTLRSATDGFRTLEGGLLDGDGNGTAGDDFSDSFVVATPAANTVTVAVPDFVRGPGQGVNLPADTNAGIPLSLSNTAGARLIDLQISYDPALLEITTATVASAMPSGAAVVLNNLTPGLAILTFFSPTALPAGSHEFVNLQASVPLADANDVYGSQVVLDIHSVTIRDGSNTELPVIDDDGLHLAAFFGDVSGNGRINAGDAAQVARFAALIESGFSGSANADPIIVGDVSGNGRLNAADASLVARFAALLPVPQIPPIPGGVVFTGLAVGDMGPGLPGILTASPKPTNLFTAPIADHSPSSSPAPSTFSTASDIRYPAVDRAMAEFGDSALHGDDDELLPPLDGAVEELLSAELLLD